MATKKQQDAKKTVKPRSKEVADPQKILNAALELMALNGYSGTSISMICEKSGYPPVSIYWHFGNKQKLLLAALEHGLSEVHYKQLDIDQLSENYERSLEQADEEFLRNPPLVLRMMFLIGLENDGNNQEITEVIKKVRTLARKVFKQHIEYLAKRKNKIVDPLTIESITDMVLAIGDGLMLSQYLEPNRVDLAKASIMRVNMMKALIDQYC